MPVNLSGFNATVSSPRGQLALHAWESQGVHCQQLLSFDGTRERGGAAAEWHHDCRRFLSCCHQRQGLDAVASLLA